MIIKLFYERFRHSDTDKRGAVGPWPSAHVNYNLYFQTSQNGVKCTSNIALSVKLSKRQSVKTKLVALRIFAN